MTFVGSKTLEIKKRGLEIDLRLWRLFDLCDFDLGRVNCMFKCVYKVLIIATKVNQLSHKPSYNHGRVSKICKNPTLQMYM